MVRAQVDLIGASDLAVDAPQLVAHRPLEIRGDDHPERTEFLAFSAHKKQAPPGIRILIGPKSVCGGEPKEAGGGTVELVGKDEIV